MHGERFKGPRSCAQDRKQAISHAGLEARRARWGAPVAGTDGHPPMRPPASNTAVTQSCHISLETRTERNEAIPTSDHAILMQGDRTSSAALRGANAHRPTKN